MGSAWQSAARVTREIASRPWRSPSKRRLGRAWVWPDPRAGATLSGAGQSSGPRGGGLRGHHSRREHRLGLPSTRARPLTVPSSLPRGHGSAASLGWARPPPLCQFPGTNCLNQVTQKRSLFPPRPGGQKSQIEARPGPLQRLLRLPPWPRASASAAASHGVASVSLRPFLALEGH